MAIMDKLHDIAEAIREKTGETGVMTLAQMPEKIRSIETGSGEGESPTSLVFVQKSDKGNLGTIFNDIGIYANYSVPTGMEEMLVTFTNDWSLTAGSSPFRLYGNATVKFYNSSNRLLNSIKYNVSVPVDSSVTYTFTPIPSGTAYARLEFIKNDDSDEPIWGGDYNREGSRTSTITVSFQ